jgi:hypothetical protein
VADISVKLHGYDFLYLYIMYIRLDLFGRIGHTMVNGVDSISIIYVAILLLFFFFKIICIRKKKKDMKRQLLKMHDQSPINIDI